MQLRAFINDSPSCVAMFGQDMRYLAASRRWMQDYGLTDTVIGQSHYEVFPDIPASWKDVHRRGLAGETIQKEEDAFPRDNGSALWLKWEVRPWYPSKGEVGGIIIFSEDITRRKEAELQRDANILALKESNGELDSFAHMVSHDLKEPLRGLCNQASFLIDDFGEQLPEDGRRRLQRMVDLGERMQRLINDLLFFSSLGRSELQIQMADPNAMVRDVEQLTESLVLERRAQIVIPRKMPQLLCDKTQITEVFLNLITNAIKYNDKAVPTIEIGFMPEVVTAQSTETNVYYVKDNGVGIPEQFYTDIFRMFKRLQTSATTARDGTGAGLAFVKKIIERHGGRIWLESKPDLGTSFCFTVPQSPNDMAPRC